MSDMDFLYMDPISISIVMQLAMHCMLCPTVLPDMTVCSVTTANDYRTSQILCQTAHRFIHNTGHKLWHAICVLPGHLQPVHPYCAEIGRFSGFDYAMLMRRSVTTCISR